MSVKASEYLRSFLFGVEDSLISTTGFVAGLSIGSSNRSFIILAGLTAIIIEGVSMGVGEYLSDEALDELDKVRRHRDSPLISGLLLAVSYIGAGMIPFIPLVTLSFPTSLILSVTLAMLALFLIGYIKGRYVKKSPFKSGLKILLVGGITTVLGVVVGSIFRI